MARESKIKRAWAEMDWRLSLFQLIIAVPTAIASFALPAWAVRAARVFEQYAPLSWVVAGFAGLLSAVVLFLLFTWAKVRWVRARYDARLLAQGGEIDPLAKTFERKRIYLNEFMLPSHPVITGKTFIDCEIIGPANIILDYGNRVSEPQYPLCDAVLLGPDASPFNGYYIRNCTFRACSFIRVTFLVTQAEYPASKNVDWLNWITSHPEVEPQFLYDNSTPPPPYLPEFKAGPVPEAANRREDDDGSE